jgi:membrane-bound lytic murein transglycosylase D
MTEEALRSINNIPPRVVIKAGSSLLVPRSSHMETDVGVHVADNGQMSLGPDIVLKRTVVKAGKKDTVASMALRYGVNAASLAEWNKTTPAAAFKSGQAVTLFMATAPRILGKNKPANKPQNTKMQAKAKNAKVVSIAKK